MVAVVPGAPVTLANTLNVMVPVEVTSGIVKPVPSNARILKVAGQELPALATQVMVLLIKPATPGSTIKVLVALTPAVKFTTVTVYAVVPPVAIVLVPLVLVTVRSADGSQDRKVACEMPATAPFSTPDAALKSAILSVTAEKVAVKVPCTKRHVSPTIAVSVANGVLTDIVVVVPLRFTTKRKSGKVGELVPTVIAFDWYVMNW